jgi:uncharacterized coiled-coil protein SlyX
VSTAESYLPEPSSDRKRLIFSINQIAEQLAKVELESDRSDQSVPVLIGSYCEFNIVKFNENYYGVRQSLGKIDWSLSDSEFANRYGESDFFRCSDKNAIINRIGLNELLAYIEELSSVIAEAHLRQEAVLDRLIDRQVFEERLATQASQIENCTQSLTEVKEHLSRYSVSLNRDIVILTKRLDQNESDVSKLKASITYRLVNLVKQLYKKIKR